MYRVLHECNESAAARYVDYLNRRGRKLAPHIYGQICESFERAMQDRDEARTRQARIARLLSATNTAMLREGRYGPRCEAVTRIKRSVLRSADGKDNPDGAGDGGDLVNTIRITLFFAAMICAALRVEAAKAPDFESILR